MAVRPYRATTEIFRPLFDDFLGANNGGRLAGMDLLRTPEADVLETKDEIRVTVELPGVHPDEVEVNLEDNVLAIAGEKLEQEQQAGSDQKWHLSERRYGRFARTFVLPREVDTDRIAASFDNGVLSVSIPKSEKAKPRRIQVSAAGNTSPGD